MMMSRSSENFSQKRRTAIALSLLAMAAAAFVAMCLVLEARQPPPVNPPETFVSVGAVFISQAALIVYCTILAGVLGTSVRILGNRLSMQSVASGSDGIGAVAAQVFLGGAFAFAAGFLLPHALATKTIADSYNVWSLMIVGGFAGYVSTGVAGSVNEGLQGLLTGLRQGVADAIVKEEVSRTIADSAREAMTLPEPVAYTGHVEIEITDEQQVSAVRGALSQAETQGDASTASAGPALSLSPETMYYIYMRLVPQGTTQDAKSKRPISLPIDIEGVPAETTPLDIRIDYGFDQIVVSKHIVDASSGTETEVPAFKFQTPPAKELEAPSIEPSIPRRLTIAILQNRIPYLRQQIPIDLSQPKRSPLVAGRAF